MPQLPAGTREALGQTVSQFIQGSHMGCERPLRIAIRR